MCVRMCMFRDYLYVFLSIYLSVCLCFCLIVCLFCCVSVCLYSTYMGELSFKDTFIHLFVCLSTWVCLFVYLSVCLCVHLSVYSIANELALFQGCVIQMLRRLNVCLFVCRFCLSVSIFSYFSSLCFFVYLSVYLCVCLFICLFVCLYSITNE